MTSSAPQETISSPPEAISESTAAAPETPAKTPGQRATRISNQATKTLGNPWLLAALLLAVLASWQWYSSRQQLNQQQQAWEKRLSDSDIATQESRAQTKQLQEQHLALQTRFNQLEDKLDQGNGLQATQHDLALNRELALLAEVEHVLVLAIQQLQVSADVATALNTLQSIDHRLAKIEQTQFPGLRKAIAHDIERLRKIPLIDLAGMSQRLESFLVGVDRLSFNMDTRPSTSKLAPEPSAELPAWAALLNSVWSEIKGLIRIERIEGNTPVLLSNEHQFFVRESLKLRLLSARLSLLARDQNSFRHELEASQSLLSRHFNSEDKAVQNTQAALQQFTATPLLVDVPNLTESLNAVRQAQQQTEKKSKP